MAFSSRLLGHHFVFDAWTLSIWRRLRNVNARNGKGGSNGDRKAGCGLWANSKPVHAVIDARANSRLKASRTRKRSFQDANELGEAVRILLQRLGFAVVDDVAFI